MKMREMSIKENMFHFAVFFFAKFELRYFFLWIIDRKAENIVNGIRVTDHRRTFHSHPTQDAAPSMQLRSE